MKSGKYFWSVALVLVLLQVACKKEGTEKPLKPSCFEPDYSDSVEYDLYREWEFLGFLNADQSQICKPEGAGYYGLDIQQGSGYYYCFCNDGIIQKLEVNGDSISMTDLLSTLKGCFEYMDLDSWYTSGLRDARTFRIDHDILNLNTEQGASLKFRAKK